MEWNPPIKIETKSAIQVGDAERAPIQAAIQVGDRERAPTEVAIQLGTKSQPEIQIPLMDVAVANFDLAVRAFGEGRVVGDDDDRAALVPEVGE